MIAYPSRSHLASLVLAGAGIAGSASVQAAPFLYTSGDLVLTLRQPGASADLVVNLGRASTLSALPADSTLVLTNLSKDLLSTTFANLNGLKWAVGGANRPPGDAAFPLQTLWVTAGRADSAVASVPWLRKGQFVQGTAASQVDGVGYNAAQASNLLPAGPSNSAGAVAVPLDSPFTIGLALGDEGNYVGTFQGPVEAVTADDFDGTASNVSRADLYELLPGTSGAGTLNQPGRRLGTFEFKPDGTLAFSNASDAPTAPTISSVSRTGDVTTVSFTTVSGVTYQLRASATPGISAPLNSWEAGPTVVGTGSTQSLQFTDSNSARFFVIEARR